MHPTKSSLANCGVKPSPHVAVTFRIEETDKFVKENNNIKRPTRKKAAEPHVIHEMRPWYSFAGVPATEQILTDKNKQPDNQRLNQVIVCNQSFSFNQERPNRYRSALIDRNKQNNYHHTKY